jgi:hypothetical protein
MSIDLSRCPTNALPTWHSRLESSRLTSGFPSWQGNLRKISVLWSGVMPAPASGRDMGLSIRLTKVNKTGDHYRNKSILMPEHPAGNCNVYF